MKNAVFWDIIIQFLPHRRHITFCYRAKPVTVMWDLRFSRWWLWRMPSSGMWCRVALVRTEVSEELTISIIRVKWLSELGTALASTRNWIRLRCSYLTDSCHSDDGGDTFLRNIGSYKNHKESHPRWRDSSQSQPSEFLARSIHFTTSGGRSVGMVRSRTKGHGVCLFVICQFISYRISHLDKLTIT
jgi:hypothetical protein